MTSYLVTGLESSCTKVVSRLIALNLGIIEKENDWDGHEDINNEYFSVVHKSLPHGARRDNFGYINESYAQKFDVVVISTRDINSIIKSKKENHQPDLIEINRENDIGIEVIKNIIDTHSNFFIFSYESALLLQKTYTRLFLSAISVPHIKDIEFKNINKKYMIED